MGAILYTFTALLAIAAYYLNEPVRILMGESAFENATQSDLSTCTNISALKGCEDLKIYHSSNFAFIGCPEDYTLNREWTKLGYNPKIKIPYNINSFIYSYDLDKIPKKLKAKNLPTNFTFVIHGIDILKDDKDQNKLHIYGINHHLGGQDIVEHFTHQIGSSSIEYIESFENNNFQNLNAVLVVTSKKIYYSKDMTHSSGLLNLLEGGKVMFMSESGDVREVITGLKYANGLAFNHNKELLYHSESIRGRLTIFDRDPETNELEQREVITIKAFLDNINVDPKSGHLYIPGFPPKLETIKRMGTFETLQYQPIDSMIFRISNQTDEGRFFGENCKVDTILTDKSGKMSVTTVSVSYEEKNILLLSGILY